MVCDAVRNYQDESSVPAVVHRRWADSSDEALPCTPSRDKHSHRNQDMSPVNDVENNGE